MQIQRNPFPTFAEKVWRAVSHLANQLTRGRLQEFVAESRARREARLLIDQIDMFLEGRRDFLTGFPIPMTIRQLSQAVRCGDQIDLEFALQELIDEGRIRCSHVDGTMLARLQWLEMERALLSEVEGVGSGSAGSEYTRGLKSCTKRIDDLTSIDSALNFWDLRVVHLSVHPPF